MQLKWDTDGGNVNPVRLTCGKVIAWMEGESAEAWAAQIAERYNAYDALKAENEALILYTRALLALELCLDENIDDATVVDEASQRVKNAWQALPPSVREKLEKEPDDA